MEHVRVEVAIVGGGIAGFSAAYRLAQAGVESLLVLEAKERVGGRTMRVPLDLVEHAIDGGGELIGPGQDAMYRLLDELGLAYFETHFEGRSIYQLGDERGTFTGSIPPLPAAALAEYERAVQAMDALAATVPPEAPWEAPEAAALDRLTLAAWLDANVESAATRAVLARKFANSFGFSAAQVSFLYTLAYLAGCGLLARSFSAASHRIERGAHALAEALAARLDGRVRLATPVQRIDQSSPAAVVVHGQGIEVEARRVIVAMHPGDCRSIAFAPHLPARRALLHGAWRAAPAIKFHAIYREPFWRELGYSGYAYLDLGSIPSVFDASPADGSLGSLMLWVLPFIEGPGFGDPAFVYDDPARRRDAILQLLASWFGARALDPLTCAEVNWLEEPYTLGCGCATTPGVLTAYGPALREPVGRVHWASSETSAHWSGYMAGAIESGERAAHEVLEACAAD